MTTTITILALSYTMLVGNGICRAEDEITEALATANNLIVMAEKESVRETKQEKYNEAKAALNKVINKIEKGGRVYTDEELAPLYIIRGLCHYEMYEYEKALKDSVLSAKLDPKRITPHVIISMIKSSAPEEKLRQGKEALIEAQHAMKAYKIAWDAAQNEKTPLERLQAILSLGDIRSKCVEALAAAHAENGNFKEALNALKAGLENDQSTRTKIEQYRDSKPNRLPALPK